MIRVVIDTNIFISAANRPEGRVGEVVRLFRAQQILLIYSQPLVDELIEKLTAPRIQQKYELAPDDITGTVTAIAKFGEKFEVSGNINVCRDLRDNFLLETAVSGQADYLVTGDNDLLVLNPFQGISIVAPAMFLKAVEE